jgi:hypothetical protein
MIWGFKVIGPHAFDLSKWGEDAQDGSEREPQDVYHIRGGYCSCPARVHICKHLAAVMELKDDGTNFEGLMYDPDKKVKYYWPNGETLDSWLKNNGVRLSSTDSAPS